ncbi:formate dehydrogenase accessory sulfurtransferase FdhD [Desulfitobacterium sp.]|uniref:formate dehydrogenase accessory sulfurtransferase FdhD n=1 Tax=Desulfitobacterium sp. TaxID=49981 RepID=UPI002B91D775|nr:formate dehydrogenase accessory sulfurtransferase FdhD [Desulfitobacterium sp.]HVJ49751.1 formate dehydrogenase accessory sulfurtransferase FdhD [Desulfitobacterium sp.]
MSTETVQYSILKAQGNFIVKTEDVVVQEIPLTLFFNEEEIATLLCSPSQLEELAYGFLYVEGFIHSASDIHWIRYDPKLNVVWAEGTSHLAASELLNKRTFSACCGKSRVALNFANDENRVVRQTSDLRISLDEAYGYIKYLQEHLPLFQSTGGIHSGGVGYQGHVLLTSYDIGRHNVFDKLAGSAVRAGIELKDHVLFFSGRISSEILLKLAKMNIPILIARSAPTDLALKLAQDLNITVIGFARENRLNIYTCPERILTPSPISSET